MEQLKMNLVEIAIKYNCNILNEFDKQNRLFYGEETNEWSRDVKDIPAVEKFNVEIEDCYDMERLSLDEEFITIFAKTDDGDLLNHTAFVWNMETQITDF
jgi:hypothetical protein